MEQIMIEQTPEACENKGQDSGTLVDFGALG